MPKCILKHFVNDKNVFFYYDVVSKRIFKGHPKSLNTESDFYSIETEQFLSNYIEKPFSEIVKLIDRISKTTHYFELTGNDVNIIINFARALLVRNPLLIEEATQTPHLFLLKDQQIKNSNAVLGGLTVAARDKLFNDFSLTILSNKTSIPLFLPILGIYEYYQTDGRKMLIPINPNTAILLFEKKHMSKYTDTHGKISKFIVNDEESIINLNLEAIMQQQRMKYGSVVSPSKELLEKLLSKLT